MASNELKDYLVRAGGREEGDGGGRGRKGRREGREEGEGGGRMNLTEECEEVATSRRRRRRRRESEKVFRCSSVPSPPRASNSHLASRRHLALVR
eukprot:639513-Hanusia_phi.AAC.1